MKTPSQSALDVAQRVVEKKLGKDQVHTVYQGEVFKNGKPTGEVGIIAVVDDKMPSAQMKGDPLPEAIPACGEIVRVDVREDAQPSPELLMLSDAEMIDFAAQYMPQFNVQASVQDWQRCHNVPLSGGLQIAPENAGWVGTLTCAVIGNDRNGKPIVGALTNYHVAMSSEKRDIKMGQPNGSGGHWFSKVENWARIEFNTSANNRVDGAFLNTWRDDGPYAPGCHTVKPEQFQLGKINPSPVLQHKVGDLVHKSGRTTGYQKGRVTGVNATSHISYGQGTARFVGQTIITGLNGLFSGPGDSGSLVLEDPSNRPYGLLFAGGGNSTIINPIADVIQAFGLKFFAA